MNSMTENGMMCKLKACADKLCSMKVSDKLDFSMTVSSKDDGGNEENCFYKKISSDTEFQLLKALALTAAVGVTVALVCSACSMMKKK